MQIEYERGISNPGNLYRMKNLMARAETGETLNIGFLGGSITQGCLASTPELCYAYRVFQWWEKTFPQAEFHYINAGFLPMIGFSLYLQIGAPFCGPAGLSCQGTFGTGAVSIFTSLIINSPLIYDFLNTLSSS